MSHLAYGSSSALPLLMMCSGPAVLPRSRNEGDKANEGTAIHEHLQLRASHGVDEAMQRLDAMCRKHGLTDEQTSWVLHRCRTFEYEVPAGSLGEVSLCWMADGSVRRIVGGRGSYDLPEGGLVPGQIDLIWSEPEPLDLSDPEHPRCPKGSVLWVLDWKGGKDQYVEPVEINKQIRHNTMMAARWLGATHAVPAIAFPRPGKGDWDVPMTEHGEVRPLGPRDLDEIERQMRAHVARVDEQRARLANGHPLDLIESKYCQYCPSFNYCPAKASLVKRVVSGEISFDGSPLTPDEARWLATNLSSLERIAREGRDLLKSIVDENGPIDIGGGLSFRRVEETRQVINPKRALPILREELGDDVLDIAKISKESIADAIRETGQKIAPTMRRIFAKLIEADAITKKPQAAYRADRGEDSGAPKGSNPLALAMPDHRAPAPAPQRVVL